MRSNCERGTGLLDLIFNCYLRSQKKKKKSLTLDFLNRSFTSCGRFWLTICMSHKSLLIRIVAFTCWELFENFNLIRIIVLTFGNYLKIFLIRQNYILDVCRLVYICITCITYFVKFFNFKFNLNDVLYNTIWITNQKKYHVHRS